MMDDKDKKRNSKNNDSNMNEIDLGDMECKYDFALNKSMGKIKLGGGQFGTVFLGHAKGSEVAIKGVKVVKSHCLTNSFEPSKKRQR
jgi:hypothetical protein